MNRWTDEERASTVKRSFTKTAIVSYWDKQRSGHNTAYIHALSYLSNTRSAVSRQRFPLFVERNTRVRAPENVGRVETSENRPDGTLCFTSVIEQRYEFSNAIFTLHAYQKRLRTESRRRRKSVLCVQSTSFAKATTGFAIL